MACVAPAVPTAPSGAPKARPNRSPARTHASSSAESPTPDPNASSTYRHTTYTVNGDVEDIYRRWDEAVPHDELEELEAFVLGLLALAPTSERELVTAMITLRRRFKRTPRRSQLLHVLSLLELRGALPSEYAAEGEDSEWRLEKIRRLLVKKAGKSQSGVLVITVLTSPYPKVGTKVQRFSCEWNCYYCPNEPGQPRSYLHDEPSVLRANQNAFDPVLQFVDRAATLKGNGHPVDKVELLVLGGTWSSYPHEYQETFCRDLFYAANTFAVRGELARERLSLEEEQRLNEGARCKIIGLTLEMRPDNIDQMELHRLRRYGCTRVQLGVQHTDDAILKKINRGCTTEQVRNALRLLKDSCFKVDIHLMPNLPGASVEIDREMFSQMLHDEGLQADQWKIYPCEVTPWTVIKRWYDEGTYVPYEEDALMELLMEVKPKVHPWIRLNRVVRDIPSQYILGGVDSPNLRQILATRMAERGTFCSCIRCREVGNDDAAAHRASLLTRKYASNGSYDYFLSFEAPSNSLVKPDTILAFCRLRLPSTAMNGGVAAFPELKGAALVRELHVYGQLVATDDKRVDNAQHMGFGRRLMERAERMAGWRGYHKIAVISGIGTRNYYRKLGYDLHTAGRGGFMIKKIPWHSPGRLMRSSFFALLAAFISVIVRVLLDVNQTS